MFHSAQECKNLCISLQNERNESFPESEITTKRSFSCICSRKIRQNTLRITVQMLLTQKVQPTADVLSLANEKSKTHDKEIL